MVEKDRKQIGTAPLKRRLEMVAYMTEQLAVFNPTDAKAIYAAVGAMLGIKGEAQ